MVRNYIGLAISPHDPAIAIVNSSGEMVFAEGTERHLQNKRAWNNPPDDVVYIQKLLKEHCETGADLVISYTWSKRTFRFIRLFHSSLERHLKKLFPSITYMSLKNVMYSLDALRIQSGNTLELYQHISSPNSKVIRYYFDHHLTHAAAACCCSPFEEAVCAVVDGYGEGSSTGFYKYKNGKISHLSKIRPSRLGGASLGLLYGSLCWACGFDSLKGEEWKVMGLAPYGKFDQSIYQLLRPIIKVKNSRLARGSDVRSRLAQLCEMRRGPNESPLKSADLAFTGQQVFCEIFEEMLNQLYQLNVSDNLVLTGGCALNSSWNGKVLEKTPFKNLYVFSAPADDGNAVGAALLPYFKDNPPTSAPARLQLPYLGAKMSLQSLKNVQKFGNLRNSLPPKKKIHERAAELLANGKIIGWIQGRAEFGPRALGNRSILADPRDAGIKERLNESVKFREEFRPFAPSILHEYGPEYFENYQESPYMERTLRFKKEVVKKVPSVVHVDGTGRLQTVKREWNEKFYDLIQAFKDITGIPLLLNTSFNIMGKPIVHSVEDALAVFFSTGLDALVIEDLLFEKDK